MTQPSWKGLKGIRIIWHLRLHSRSPTRTISFLMYVIFLKSKGFNDFKYDMDMDMYNMVVMNMDVVDTYTYTNCFKDLMNATFLKISGFKDFKYDMDIR